MVGWNQRFCSTISLCQPSWIYLVISKSWIKPRYDQKNTHCFHDMHLLEDDFLIQILDQDSTRKISCNHLYDIYVCIYIYGCFLKWWYPKTMGFPKMIIFGCFGGSTILGNPHIILYTSWELTYPFPKALFKMIFLFQVWDMLAPWRVDILYHNIIWFRNREQTQVNTTPDLCLQLLHSFANQPKEVHL